MPEVKLPDPAVFRQALPAVVSSLAGRAECARGLGNADYGYVLETGELIVEGPADMLAQDARVTATYLGGSADVSTSSA